MLDYIADNVARIQSAVAQHAAAAHRTPSEITIVAVSKTMPIDRIEAAHHAGMRHFGENRVQEAEGKIGTVELAGVEWHLIGHLQTNKARAAAKIFDVIQSVDSLRVAEALSREALRGERQIDILLEVNISGEASKFGFTPNEIPEVATRIVQLSNLRVIGLMTVAPHVVDSEETRPVFQGVRQLGDRVRPIVGNPSTWHLSMGMSNDFAVAISEGATIVRIGRAIFGERTQP